MAKSDALCIALDGSDRSWILSIARALSTEVGWLKIGLEAFIANGPGLVGEVAALGPRVFLDLKLHDIPATVRRAAANSAACGADMLTVHAAGGRDMLTAAVEGAAEGSPNDPPRVVAVTVLTSLDRTGLDELGIGSQPEDLVAIWARLAMDCAVDGVVASAYEASTVRDACGAGFLIVTPGIRPGGSAVHDQRRVVTPAEAVAAGADILVVGRPVTCASDPVVAAQKIVEEMDTARRAAASDQL